MRLKENRFPTPYLHLAAKLEMRGEPSPYRNSLASVGRCGQRTGSDDGIGILLGRSPCPHASNAGAHPPCNISFILYFLRNHLGASAVNPTNTPGSLCLTSPSQTRRSLPYSSWSTGYWLRFAASPPPNHFAAKTPYKTNTRTNHPFNPGEMTRFPANRPISARMPIFLLIYRSPPYRKGK